MPAIGFSTFGSDQASAEKVAKAGCGAAIAGIAISTVPPCNEMRTESAKRSPIYLARGFAVKIWNDKHRENDVIPACPKSPRVPRTSSNILMLMIDG